MGEKPSGVHEENEVQIMTIDELPTSEEMNSQMEQRKNNNEEEELEEVEPEEKLNHRERRRRRKLEEDIFADFDEPEKPIKVPKKTKSPESKDSHLEVLDLNDL